MSLKYSVVTILAPEGAVLSLLAQAQDNTRVQKKNLAKMASPPSFNFGKVPGPAATTALLCCASSLA